jgi:DASS family divalent anion:Na+ symporter
VLFAALLALAGCSPSGTAPDAPLSDTEWREFQGTWTAGQRLASYLGGLSWPVTYVTLVVLYVAIHYMFVSQTSHVLALLGVFLDVGIRGGVPAPRMAFALLFASSYFSVITPQAGSQNVILVGGGYLTQGELYRLGLLTTLFFLAVFLVIGTAWILLITG